MVGVIEKIAPVPEATGIVVAVEFISLASVVIASLLNFTNILFYFCNPKFSW